MGNKLGCWLPQSPLQFRNGTGLTSRPRRHATVSREKAHLQRAAGSKTALNPSLLLPGATAQTMRARALVLDFKAISRSKAKSNRKRMLECMR